MKSKQLPEIIAELKANSKKSLATLLAVATLGTGAVALTSCDLEDDPLDTNEVSASTTESSEYLTEEPTENTTEFTTETPTEEVSEAETEEVTKPELTELRPITDEELEELYAKINKIINNFSQIRSIYIAKEANEYNLHKAYILDTNAYLIDLNIPESTFLLIKELEEYGYQSSSPLANDNAEYIQFILTSKKRPLPDDIVGKLLTPISYHIDDMFVNMDLESEK